MDQIPPLSNVLQKGIFTRREMYFVPSSKMVVHFLGESKEARNRPRASFFVQT